MSSPASNLVDKVWNYCNLLHDDGVSYGDYVEQLTYLLFLKMDYERTRPPCKQRSTAPKTTTGPASSNSTACRSKSITVTDVKGDIYEGLLEKNAQDTKSGAGQYFTPRVLIDAIVSVMRPQPGTTIIDPAAGTGGFLLSAAGYIANVLFFDRKPASETPWTRTLWIYDLRTNKHFTLKTNTLTRADLDDFVRCYNPANRHQRS
jgi:type I restriction enzyme M protein